MKGDDLSERLVNFSSRIINLANSLPKTTVGNTVCLQVVRSGTSTGANYEEARAAESKSDFIHKLSLSLKELRETRYWLLVIDRSKLIPTKRMKNLILESEELCNIIAKSIITVRKKNNLK